MFFRWRLGGLALAAVALCALAATNPAVKTGIVQTLDGHTFQGEITQDDKYITITLHNISTRLDKRNVAKITYTESLDDQFTGRLSKLAADDVKGRLDLATWASDNQRPDLAVIALQDARKIDPTNRDAAIALDNAQRQIDLDARRGTPTETPPAAGATSKPAETAPAKVVVEHRLLTDDEINIIRQKEMTSNDSRIRVRLDNGVVSRFLAAVDTDAVAFRQLPASAQALEILDANDPKLNNDVRIVTDPQPLLTFKARIYPLIAASCASTACHGGTAGGSFGLFPGTSAQAVYTNFYILQTYVKNVAGTQYSAINRTLPDQSLVLEFALPDGVGDVSHPKVPDYRARFRDRRDPTYQTIFNWINDLKPIAPRYGIAVAPDLPPPPPDAPAK
jgi:hypothetical protein